VSFTSDVVASDPKNTTTSNGYTSVEELKKHYEVQIKTLQRDLEAEKKKVKSLEAQLAETPKGKGKDTKKKGR